MVKINIQFIVRGIAMFIVFILWLTVSPITAFFWSLFLVWVVFQLDSRIIGVGALTLLVVIPIVLSTDLYEYMAEQLAVYVFFLLCITVALQILELRRDDSVPKIEQIHLPKNTKAKQKINRSHDITLPDYSK